MGCLQCTHITVKQNVIMPFSMDVTRQPYNGIMELDPLYMPRWGMIFTTILYHCPS